MNDDDEMGELLQQPPPQQPYALVMPQPPVKRSRRATPQTPKPQYVFRDDDGEPGNWRLRVERVEPLPRRSFGSFSRRIDTKAKLLDIVGRSPGVYEVSVYEVTGAGREKPSGQPPQRFFIDKEDIDDLLGPDPATVKLDLPRPDGVPVAEYRYMLREHELRQEKAALEARFQQFQQEVERGRRQEAPPPPASPYAAFGDRVVPTKMVDDVREVNEERLRSLQADADDRVRRARETSAHEVEGVRSAARGEKAAMESQIRELERQVQRAQQDADRSTRRSDTLGEEIEALRRKLDVERTERQEEMFKRQSLERDVDDMRRRIQDAQAKELDALEKLRAAERRQDPIMGLEAQAQDMERRQTALSRLAEAAGYVRPVGKEDDDPPKWMSFVRDAREAVPAVKDVFEAIWPQRSQRQQIIQGQGPGSDVQEKPPAAQNKAAALLVTTLEHCLASGQTPEATYAAIAPHIPPGQLAIAVDEGETRFIDGIYKVVLPGSSLMSFAGNVFLKKLYATAVAQSKPKP